MQHKYYVYIVTNKIKTVLYTGVTNCLDTRLFQHKDDSENEKKSFAGKYNCIYLLYYEEFQWVQDAIAREKQLKGWTKAKKLELIQIENPKLAFIDFFR